MEPSSSSSSSSSGCSRNAGGAGFLLDQEVLVPVPRRKRRSREDEEEGQQMKRRRRKSSWKENTDPGERYKQIRTRTRTRHAAGFQSGLQVQSRRAEIKMALVQNIRVQNPEDGKVLGSTETHLDQNQDSRTSSKLLETRTRTRTRRRVRQSAISGRGRLRLCITVEAGRLNVQIHEARGLMGKSSRSCDSYVKLSVTSDLHHSIRMKTRMVLNNPNPTYLQNFSLCVSEPLLLSRLLISVLRRRPDSRCSQLIGCMSFWIDSLIRSSQPITGWFYLLGEEFGHSKHLRVTSQSNRPIRNHQVKVEQQGAEPRADLRRTPDPAPDAPDADPILAGTDGPIRTSPTGPKVTTQHSVAPGGPGILDSDSSNVPSVLYGSHRLEVSIIRGTNGFGFTICSDCPVRVQAVEPGGPAHQAGLHQGDSLLQLNGLPVETWTCADLAQAIRGCRSRVVLVVWRRPPELGSSCETWLRPQLPYQATSNKLLSNSAHSKHGRRGLRAGLGVLGSLWRDQKVDQDQNQDQNQEDREVFSTLKGTRVTSSNGDNYIILSPVDPGEQLQQPIYHNRNGTIGRLYQTHPSRGHHLLHNARTGTVQQTGTGHTSTLTISQPRTTAPGPPGNHGNYQNCTIVQSHLPRPGYGNYAAVPPKTLIFPIFVQPLDLCRPDRTLRMSEEMILHQADLLPSKVTVLIFSDLLLITREDSAGRCNVLQSPLYLNTLQLREVPSEPLRLYFMQRSDSCWFCLFSLEAFSIQQKLRVSLCLHDNRQHHLVTMETPLPYQLSDLPSDLGLLSLSQSDLPFPPSSPYSSLSESCRPPSPPSPVSPPPLYTSMFPPSMLPPPSSSCSTLRSPVWKQREEEEERMKSRHEEEEEERQQGEGESSSEASESVGGFRSRGLHRCHLMDEDQEEEEESGCGPPVLRRSLSEGSLLQEPRSPRFLSDSTIHRLKRTSTFDPRLDSGSSPCPPSPGTLRKHLTKDDASLHHMLLLLNGSKQGKSRSFKLMKKKHQSVAADIQSRLSFLRRRKNLSGLHGNSLEKALRNSRPSEEEVRRWAESLETLLTNQYGVAVFCHFLRSEFSEENLDFWLAVETFKRTRPFSKMAAQAKKIYDEFISPSAPRQVNVDSFVRGSTNYSLSVDLGPASFQLAQDQIFNLMETDSYPRFLKSRVYAQLANQRTSVS